MLKQCQYFTRDLIQMIMHYTTLTQKEETIQDPDNKKYVPVLTLKLGQVKNNMSKQFIFEQCCGSEMFIPDPDFYPFPISDTGSNESKKVGSGSASNNYHNPDPLSHLGYKSNRDPHQRDADPQHCHQGPYPALTGLGCYHFPKTFQCLSLLLGKGQKGRTGIEKPKADPKAAFTLSYE